MALSTTMTADPNGARIAAIVSHAGDELVLEVSPARLYRRAQPTH
jgi:hypothetical protein